MGNHLLEQAIEVRGDQSVAALPISAEGQQGLVGCRGMWCGKIGWQDLAQLLPYDRTSADDATFQQTNCRVELPALDSYLFNGGRGFAKPDVQSFDQPVELGNPRPAEKNDATVLVRLQETFGNIRTLLYELHVMHR
ncbi:MAG: hypothetical protein ACREYE_15020 [Gammaproteobacteria bacterium]